MDEKHKNKKYEDKKYEDLLELPHHVSKTHPPMSMIDRAAQFSPFAALTGYEGEIKETARLTDQRLELDEQEKTALDEKLWHLQQGSKSGRMQRARFTYFLQDPQKQGGSYISAWGGIRKIDPIRHCIIMEDRTEIPIEDLIDIEEEDGGHHYASF